jgi:hypothetical protein
MSERHLPKGIVRIDDDRKNIHGFFVRVMWMGENHRKFFSDSVHDDPLEEAISWRDETERALGKPRTEQWIRGYGIDPKGRRWSRQPA